VSIGRPAGAGPTCASPVAVARGRQRSAGCGVCAPGLARAIRKGSAGGVERALYDEQLPGRAEVLADSEKQHVIAMVCSDPPEGRAAVGPAPVAREPGKRKLDRPHTPCFSATA
jgi:hypothetical protein